MADFTGKWIVFYREGGMVTFDVLDDLAEITKAGGEPIHTGY